MSVLTVTPLRHARAQRTGQHSHDAGQLFVVRTGTVQVQTGGTRWLVPAGCLGWVPPRCAHEADYPAAVEGEMVYVDAGGFCRRAPATLKVVRMTALTQEALARISDPAMPWRRRALYALVLADALAHAPSVAAGVPLPVDRRLRRVAEALLAMPDDAADLAVWAARAEMSRSTFIRHFRTETGLGFGEWRQQLRVWRALAMLMEGRPVTEVALTVGYRSASAFIQAFRRLHGVTPSAFADRE
ncbi:MAG: helix-turn-helix domain-containing protein [Paludibacterium sp.]|uniref:AraC family transcriptional regulator n=1 Tax=Paludibacterium sp. TaxID=1917523 RepID=UPI0025DBEFEF|nr:AraC family transcriptional regulator [Paludibacterium sp.]MBV8048854.1 helix-turn-helix domain-containing protein [Paludibacterium sp.]